MGTSRMPRGAVAVALAVVVLAATIGVAAVHGGDGQQPSVSAPQQSAPAQREAVAEPSQPDGTTDVALQQGLARIASTPRYAGKPASPRINGAATEQADLYATEFVRRLLSRDYARVSRDSHLAWVQAESAATTEPLVIGLVPESARDRFAVWSVTDSTAGPAPVPEQDEWTQLASQRTVDTAQVERIHQPVVWTNAVASGRITDPGVTAREVSATVTRTSPAGTQRFSVAVSLNLEGPPVRATLGVVGVITFTSIPVGPS
ncbi:hypothetical protein LL946_04745 [Knoellia locipacati]|uniref:hypothetical protein n=1 Tax=Knoellia locipacati TaxID=882824 RepID=UPI003850008D